MYDNTHNWVKYINNYIIQPSTKKDKIAVKSDVKSGGN